MKIFLPGFLGLALCLAITLGGSVRSQGEPEAREEFIVHEWGVLGVGFNGNTPVMGSTETYLESLPDFVLVNEEISPTKFNQTVRQDLTVWKPVVHFYGEEGQEVELKIKVGTGCPLVYYPKPALGVTNRSAINERGVFGTLTQAEEMKWKLKLSKGDPGNLPDAPEDNWWPIARKIPSDYVIMDDDDAGNERFVFYEGTTYKSPSVNATVAEEVITVRNSHSSESGPVILIINDNTSRSCVYIDNIAATGKLDLTREDLEPWDDATLFAQCRKQWQAFGMTPQEAAGIVECWRSELAEKPGFLLISRVPEPIYEQIFPLAISPQPTELVRACLVFDLLPGQNERQHWIPEIREEGSKLIEALAADSFKERMAARSKLLSMGEIISPFLAEILADLEKDAQSRISASDIYRILSTSQVCVPPLMQDAKAPGIYPVDGVDRFEMGFRILPVEPEVDPSLFPDDPPAEETPE